MKRLLVIFIVLAMLSPISFAGKKVTEVEKYQAQFQALVQKRQQHINTINQIELEMLKVKAVIDYLTKDEKDDKKGK